MYIYIYTYIYLYIYSYLFERSIPITIVPFQRLQFGYVSIPQIYQSDDARSFDITIYHIMYRRC